MLVVIVVVLLILVFFGAVTLLSSTTPGTKCKSDEVFIGRQCVQRDVRPELKSRVSTIHEDGGGTLDCPAGTILDVVNAKYAGGAASMDMTEAVRNKCNSNEDCFYPGGNWPRDFGWADIEPGSDKTLTVRYTCIEDRT